MSPAAPELVRRELLDGAGIARTLRRIAMEIAERHGGADDVVLVGVRTGGVHLAERLRDLLREIEGKQLPVGALDIALYRDDVWKGLPRPEVGPTDLPFSIEDKVIVLVDDVLYTGRTVRAALDELMEFGRPRAVELCVLVDRGHRELPVRADYVGVSVETTRRQVVKVLLRERGGGDDQVVLKERVA
jgi:pyrimidine operon attenuation protein / uracil phosphoribosyltransferase